MNNKLINLNNYLFEQLERLNDDDILDNDDNLKKELARTKAITTVSSNIINNAKLALDAKKYVDEYGERSVVPLMLRENDEK